MRETWATKYGRNIAVLVNDYLNKIAKEKRLDYWKRFIKELKKYSFKPRKKGEPCNEGCVYELSDLTSMDISPKQLAKLVKRAFI